MRALAMLEKAMGPEHPDVARCLDNLGLLYESVAVTTAHVFSL
jgi:hypothetical protein